MDEDLLDPKPSELDLPITDPAPPDLSGSVAASVAAAQAALEDSMNKASALQMTAMQTAIAEFKAAAEEVRGLSGMLKDALLDVEELKLEALELVEALTPNDDGQDGPQGGGSIQNSMVNKPTHIQILKRILSK